MPVHRPAFHHEGHIGKRLVVDKPAEVGKEGGLGNLARQQSRTEFKGPEIIESIGREGGRKEGREERSRLKEKEQDEV